MIKYKIDESIFEKIDNESKKRYATLAIRWCESYFGLCDRKKRRLIFRFSERKRKIDNCDVFGNYCFYRNEIIIYLPNNNTIYDVVATVIHEYTHSLQPCRKHYFRLLKEYGYKKHPYEIEARKSEVLFKKVLREYRKIYPPSFFTKV